MGAAAVVVPGEPLDVAQAESMRNEARQIWRKDPVMASLTLIV
jgi:hypothetical protein